MLQNFILFYFLLKGGFIYLYETKGVQGVHQNICNRILWFSISLLLMVFLGLIYFFEVKGIRGLHQNLCTRILWFSMSLLLMVFLGVLDVSNTQCRKLFVCKGCVLQRLEGFSWFSAGGSFGFLCCTGNGAEQYMRMQKFLLQQNFPWGFHTQQMQVAQSFSVEIFLQITNCMEIVFLEGKLCRVCLQITLNSLTFECLEIFSLPFSLLVLVFQVH